MKDQLKRLLISILPALRQVGRIWLCGRFGHPSKQTTTLTDGKRYCRRCWRFF